MNASFVGRITPRAWLLILAATMCAAPPSALAHARLVKANPADKSELSTAPDRIELWFSELLDDGFNSVSVFAAKDLSARQRFNLTKGEPAVDEKDRTRLVVTLEKLPPGEYVVEWRVLSRDGHSAPGRFRFRVGMVH